MSPLLTRGVVRSAAAAMCVGLVLALMLAAGREAEAPSAPAAPRSLWIPPGTYTAIVVVSTAQRRRWAVGLVSNEQTLPIVVAPSQTIIIPFQRGWEVHPNDNARITVDGVITDVSLDVKSLTDEAAIAITAWGVSPTGPIPFVVR